jgi:DNA phosphorothioation-associated putative methyltransferase
MVGKQVGGDLYLHRKSLGYARTKDRDLIENFELKLSQDELDWNVVRISSDNIAFLWYKDFMEQPFPELRKSVRFEIFDEQKSVKDFSSYSNPPILHRKELLLPRDHPNFQLYSSLTSTLEQMNLFFDSHKIGFRNQWESRLEENGVKVKDHEVSVVDTHASLQIERHRTALVRYQLSQPVQLLNQWGLLAIGASFFDYGCGRGDDVAALRDAGVVANGWDPHYASDASKIPSEVVNLGFVLNVIEDVTERELVLKNAWQLTRKVLSVAVLNPYSLPLDKARKFKDGVVTSRNTFQKYFTQTELKCFIESNINAEPIAIAPGIFWVFKDQIALQEFLIAKVSRRRNRSLNFAQRPIRIAQIKLETRFEKARPALEHLSSDLMDLGRPLHDNEVSQELRNALNAHNISLSAAQNFCLQNICDRQQMAGVANERRDDLLLYFAGEIFRRQKPYRELPPRLQQDIKFFWGSYLNAQEDARNLLFSVGDKNKIRDAAHIAVDDGHGYLLPGSKLQFHRSVLGKIPLILRCYVACASVLIGDVEDADLIKIHVSSRKLSLLYFEDFSVPLPVLTKRVKIDLQALDVSHYEYSSSDKQYLYLKSRFIPEDFDGFESQVKFEKALLSMAGQFDFSELGPSAEEFDAFLRQLGGIRSVHLKSD